MTFSALYTIAYLRTISYTLASSLKILSISS